MQKTILKAIPFAHKDDNLDLILAYLPEKQEYVVWTRNNEFGGFSNGKYFTSIESAENQFGKDYEKYCK